MLGGRRGRTADRARGRGKREVGLPVLSEALLGLEALYAAAGLDEEILGTLLRIQRGRRRRRSELRPVVDWGLAERTAGAVIGGIGPFGQPPPVPAEDAYGAAEVATRAPGRSRARKPGRGSVR